MKQCKEVDTYNKHLRVILLSFKNVKYNFE